MEKFLELLNSLDIDYEIQDGTVIVKNKLTIEELDDVKQISIPENTNFWNGLRCNWTDGEIQLPKNLNVGHILDLENTNVTRLPSNLTIYGDCSVYLNAHKIKNVSYSDNCGDYQRTIFAFWANDDFLIAAGCFAGTYSRFERRVNEEYHDTTEASVYKRKARGCISRVAKKLGKPDPFKKVTAK
ncbi:hypothetical protein [Gilliamella apicola]|uniref:hypothetical protein n=1 Tax=Gilliamella apicola TaxID=1196095 RepID=UPI002FEE314F